MINNIFKLLNITRLWIPKSVYLLNTLIYNISLSYIINLWNSELSKHEKYETEGTVPLKYSNFLQVSRVLPDWLASPNVIASDLKQKTTLVSEFKGLDPDIHKNLKENQIDYFFPGTFILIKIFIHISSKLQLYRYM